MSLPPLAPVSELERRLGLTAGTLAGSDLMRAGAALDDASDLIRAEAGTDWVAADGVTITAPRSVIVVARNVALRQYKNPDRNQGETVGPYSQQLTADGSAAYLTDDEITIIRKAVAMSGAGPGGVYSVRTPSAYSAPAIGTVSGIWLEI